MNHHIAGKYLSICRRVFSIIKKKVVVTPLKSKSRLIWGVLLLAALICSVFYGYQLLMEDSSTGTIIESLTGKSKQDPIQIASNVVPTQSPNCFCWGDGRCYGDGCERKPLQDGSLQWSLICQNDFCGGRPYGMCYDSNSTDVNRHFCIDQPSCCEEMLRHNEPGSTGNPEGCCWPERGYCHPYYCEQMGRPEQCGWYWEYHAGSSESGYGCTIGNSPSSLSPIYGLPTFLLSLTPGASTPTNTGTAPTPTYTVPPGEPTVTETPIPTATGVPPTPTGVSSTGEPPFPSCPTGDIEVLRFGSGVLAMTYEETVTFNFQNTDEQSGGKILAWQGEGHNWDNRCRPGPNNDSGASGCDQNQTDEQAVFYINDQNVGEFIDHSPTGDDENYYYEFQVSNIPSGSNSLRLDHILLGQYTAGLAHSVFYKGVVCIGDSGNPPPTETPIPTNTRVPSPTRTATPTPTHTPTRTPTSTPTTTPTHTPTLTLTLTPTSTPITSPTYIASPPTNTLAPGQPTPTLRPGEPTYTLAPGTATLTLQPGEPTYTLAPGQPTYTLAPGQPTPTLRPGEPTYTLAPGTATLTLQPGEPTYTLAPGQPTPTPPVSGIGIPWLLLAIPMIIIVVGLAF